MVGFGFEIGLWRNAAKLPAQLPTKQAAKTPCAGLFLTLPTLAVNGAPLDPGARMDRALAVGACSFKAGERLVRHEEVSGSIRFRSQPQDTVAPLPLGRWPWA